MALTRTPITSVSRNHTPLTDRCGSLLGAVLLGLTALLALSLPVRGEGESTTNLTRSDRATIVDSVATLFAERYVYPEKGEHMASMLRAKLAEGDYDVPATLAELTDSMRSDLLEASDDRHIWIQPIPEDRFYVTEGDTVTEDQIFAGSLNNFGWKKLDWLPGAVGYIDVVSFEDAAFASETAEAALSFMANCQALIMDLRRHAGGHENMVRLVAGYFFEEPTLLGSLHWTYLDSTKETWTSDSIHGTGLYDKDLYLLTSKNTSSAAEAFTYRMKHLGRATIIGERTLGAAHWSDWYEFPQLNIVVHIPVARPINPVTGTNWEGTGVSPDIEAPVQNALDAGQLAALKRIKQRATDARLLREVEWAIPAVEARMNPSELNEALAQAYIGTYTNTENDKLYNIVFEDGKLSYCHYSGRQWVLIPMTESLFAFPDDNDVRVMFVTDAGGRATEFRLLVSDGAEYTRPRAD